MSREIRNSVRYSLCIPVFLRQEFFCQSQKGVILLAALTEKGFQRPLYAELVTQQTSRAKVLFGDDIETDEKTPLGKFIRLGAQDIAEAYEELESIYNSIFPNTACGASLDRVTVTAGVFRNPAIPAEQQVEFTGTPDYAIPTGFLVSGNGAEFHTEQTIKLDNSGKATATVYATKEGEAGNVPVGAITEIVNPDSEVNSVKHTALVLAGQEEETDPELRSRYHAAVLGSGSTTADAIRAAVLRVTGVRSCTVIENASEIKDASGRPPGSFECIVFAADSLDRAVAEAIFSAKPVGIRAYGSTAVQLKDSSSYEQSICFTHVSNKAVYAKVSVLTDDAFPADGMEQIKAALSASINTLGNGDNVILARLYSPITAVPGVRDVLSLQLSADGKIYSAGNIVCTPMQVAALLEDNIIVEVGSYADQ